MKRDEGLGLATEDTYLRAIDERQVRPTRAVLTFVVGGETYGVDILSIREIIKVVEVTEVPRVPPFVIGVISVRGAVIPVIDLRVRLGLALTAPTRAARILVVVPEGSADCYGLLVDAVSGVVRLGENEIEPPPATFSEGNFTGGIGRFRAGRRERIVILLSLPMVVAFEVGKGRGEWEDVP
jgi:purine-binding chemotaxis protein CheW